MQGPLQKSLVTIAASICLEYSTMYPKRMVFVTFAAIIIGAHGTSSKSVLDQGKNTITYFFHPLNLLNSSFTLLIKKK